MEKLILASASPRRRELLAQAGIPFEAAASNAKEDVRGSDPGKIVEELSCRKAQAVAENYPGRMILGADTVVVLDGRILGKPGDAAEARAMLHALQGRTHQVYTGVTLISNGKANSFHEKTDVSLYPMTEREIDDYVESGDGMDKAGSYGIQGRFAVHIRGISGDYYNVVGLPLGRLWQEYRKAAL